MGISRNVTKGPIIIDLLTIVALKKWTKVELWHKRLGHVGIQTLKLMHDKPLVSILKPIHLICIYVMVVYKENN